MSLTAHIPSHRKPRRSASKVALRAGVAGGVLSTIAVAGAAGPANAEPVTATIEMPTLTADLANTVAVSAEATQQVAHAYDLQAQQDEAAAKAAKAAKKDKAEAERKAEAEAKRKAEEAAKKKAAEEAAEKAAAEERASRSSERTTLSASADTSTGASASVGSSASTGSGNAATVVAFLKAQLGDAYVMGASGPNAWDCSSLVQAAYKTVGIDLPRVSQDQSVAGTQVGTSNLQVGDILYWGGAGSAYHVGVYIGDGQYLDAANPSKGVVIQDLSGYPASGAVRVL
ncbi:glycoside hydrolase [Streptomyces agglomeratus]|uniref:Glycoside hydrolase n=1 Tax=Streptomyces agglomeratus TaxID=285458 RepID=A0A1E5P7U6_9ACTN|nr:C40 family peptidase [Streptomyces agglomeratus]OEJ25621.1 glycoside hydrolase [Streptomyces agglomeratus]OEJ40340.1 glycoside hydrolase [Streptomyces agglomeratus]OEJ45282.1 glycoside hydrolase [Streptomyces agglomeratus]OEJ52891.1 glycoside hydrolase [Streptomyces agglomeratus]OEJ60228.1 glycoside hydrolase [Streptomyces agglomeratus]